MDRVFPNCPLFYRVECRVFCEYECRYRKQGFCKPESVS